MAASARRFQPCERDGPHWARWPRSRWACAYTHVLRQVPPGTKERIMTRWIGLGRAVCALAAVVTLAGIPSAYAQTQGMERRDDRRDDRSAGRAAKQACKAGDEKTRAE